MSDGVLMAQVLGDTAGIAHRLERERSKMTHQVFLLAESGEMPDETQRRAWARAATAQAWMTHIGASLEVVWRESPAGLGDSLEAWFANNGERREVIEMDLTARLASGAMDDETRARRRDLGTAGRWLGEGLGAVGDPGGIGGPEFARRLAAYLDRHGDVIAQHAGDGRNDDPTDGRLAESAELSAHVNAIVAGLEALMGDELCAPEPS